MTKRHTKPSSAAKYPGRHLVEIQRSPEVRAIWGRETAAEAVQWVERNWRCRAKIVKPGSRKWLANEFQLRDEGRDRT